MTTGRPSAYFESLWCAGGFNPYKWPLHHRQTRTIEGNCVIPEALQPSASVTGGPLFDEPVEVLTIQPVGQSVRLIGT